MHRHGSSRNGSEPRIVNVASGSVAESDGADAKAAPPGPAAARILGSARASRSSSSRRTGSGSGRTATATTRSNRGGGRGGAGAKSKKAASVAASVALKSVAVADYWTTKRLPQGAFSYEEIRPEFRQLDYTPISTQRPKDLDKPLRARRMQRRISLFICITAYNEGPKSLQRTLEAVGENLKALDVYGGIEWQEVLVCILMDGRADAHELTLEYCRDELKVYDPSMLKAASQGSQTVMHVFEKSVELPRHAAQREYYDPMQIMFALKETNGGKLHSHLWFFTAFCEQIQPKYTLLLDVGTAPKPGAINKLLTAMEFNDQIGGCCGELTVYKPNFVNGFSAAQHFEYKMNHMMDKAMESIFGFINVLPGAFSAYRWVAIRDGPLAQYFVVEETPIEDLDPFTANMYLAEDRVLCFSMVAKRDRNWTCHYDSGAVATTDTPSSLVGLIKQRRRWLNGAFFSLLYYLRNFHRFATEASHSVPRLAWMTVEFMYQVLQLLMNWFSAGSMFLILVIIFGVTVQEWEIGDELLYVFALFYTFLTVLQIIVGLGSEPEDMALVYWVCTWAYAALMLVSMGCGVWLMIEDKLDTFIATTGLVSFGGYFVVALLHGQLVNVLFSFFQYLVLLPMFVNVFQIYSLCNANDVSWGTKEGKLNYMHGRHVAEVSPGEQHGEDVHKYDPETERAEAAKAEATPSATTNKVTKMARMLGRNAVLAEDARVLDFGDIVKEVAPALKGKNEVDVRNQSVALLMNAATNMALSEEGPDFAKTEKVIASVLDLEARRVRRKMQEQQLQLLALKRRYGAFRTRMLGLWLLSNFVYISAILFFNLEWWFGWIFTAFVAFVLALRIVGSILYQAERLFKFLGRRLCACWLFACPCCFSRPRHASDDPNSPYYAPLRCICCGCRTQPVYDTDTESEAEDVAPAGTAATTRLVDSNAQPNASPNAKSTSATRPVQSTKPRRRKDKKAKRKRGRRSRHHASNEGQQHPGPAPTTGSGSRIMGPNGVPFSAESKQAFAGQYPSMYSMGGGVPWTAPGMPPPMGGGMGGMPGMLPGMDPSMGMGMGMGMGMPGMAGMPGAMHGMGVDPSMGMGMGVGMGSSGLVSMPSMPHLAAMNPSMGSFGSQGSMGQPHPVPTPAMNARAKRQHEAALRGSASDAGTDARRRSRGLSYDSAPGQGQGGGGGERSGAEERKSSSPADNTRLKRSESDTLAEEAFATDRRRPLQEAIDAIDRVSASGKRLTRNHSAPLVRAHSGELAAGGAGGTAATPAGADAEMAQIDAKARERERMVDLVGALEDGEGLSELLAPKTAKSARDRFQLLEQAGHSRKTSKMRVQERIDNIRKRAGRL